MTVQARRYVVKNGNDPTTGNITEEKDSGLEDFIDKAKFIMGMLGHKVFIPLVVATPTLTITQVASVPADTPDDLLYFDHSGVKVTGKQTSKGFVILKDSQISSKLTESCPYPTLRNREKYDASKVDENFVLTKDILFTSFCCIVY